MLMSEPSSANRTGLANEFRTTLPGGVGEEQGLLSALLLREVVKQNPLAISITDDQANIQYVNPAFETLTGYDIHSVIGKNESILSHKRTPKKVYEELWSAIKGKRNWRGKLLNRRKNGEAYLADVTITPVLNTQQEILCFLAIHRDVTERVSLEKQVHHQKALIESVLVSAPVVVALMDSEREVVLENEAHQRLTRDLGGRRPLLAFSEALRQEGLDLEEAFREGGGFDGYEVRLDRAGHPEPRWFSVSGTRLDELDNTAVSYFSDQVGARHCLLLVANEITVLKRNMERARLEYLRANLAEQQRIHGMREALLGAIFQIQTPLNVIQAAANMLDRGTDPQKTREVLDQVLQSGRDAMETLRHALPPRLEENESRLNLNSLLQDVLTLMTESFFAHGVAIQWQPETFLRPIFGMPNQLRSVFMCLVENAFWAVTESGHADPAIRVVTRHRGESVEVLIHDNGPGIPQELRLKVFEPFYAGWRQARGNTGMGLSVVQEIVNQHGGVIDIDPTQGEGCQVRVSFPVVDSRREVQ